MVSLSFFGHYNSVVKMWHYWEAFPGSVKLSRALVLKDMIYQN